MINMNYVIGEFNNIGSVEQSIDIPPCSKVTFVVDSMPLSISINDNLNYCRYSGTDGHVVFENNPDQGICINKMYVKTYLDCGDDYGKLRIWALRNGY